MGWEFVIKWVFIHILRELCHQKNTCSSWVKSSHLVFCPIVSLNVFSKFAWPHCKERLTWVKVSVERSASVFKSIFGYFNTDKAQYKQSTWTNKLQCYLRYFIFYKTLTEFRCFFYTYTKTLLKEITRRQSFYKGFLAFFFSLL